MFIGHIAAGLALKGLDKRIPLGWLILAATWLDLVWSALLLLGLEHARIVPGITAVNALDLYDYPISHGLLFTLGWAALFYLVYRVSPYGHGGDRHRAALILAAAVLSHWVLDLIVHRPDLPLATAASPKVGLGLWDYAAPAVAFESLLLLIGVWIYLRATRTRTALGRWGVPVFAVLLLAMNLASLAGVPPSIEVLAWSGLAGGLLFIAIAAWLDRSRQAA